jgi:Ca2+-binding RTX toxin-like protein
MLSGGTGADLLIGGAGADTFFYADADLGKGADLIADLDAFDSIDLSGIDADTVLSGDQAFAIVRHFDGHAGELRLKYMSSSNETKVMFDTDGDGQANFVVLMAGNHTSFADFVL